MRRGLIFGAALALAFLPMAGHAQGTGANAPTATGETGYFTLFTGETIPEGQWSFGLYYNNWDRLVIPSADPAVNLLAGSSSEWDYDWHRLSASVGYGVTDNFEVALMLPYDIYDASDNLRYGRINGRYFVNEIDASGIGNARLGAKWKLFEGPDASSRFAINAFVDLPTGDEDEGVATGDTGFGAGIAYDVKGWVFNLGYHDPGDPDNVDVPEEILAGIGYAASVTDRLDWITELASTVYTGDGPKADNAHDLTTGGRLWLGEDETWAFNFGLRTNLEHLSDTDEFCPIGGLVGLTFFPRGPRTHLLTVVKEGDGNCLVTSNPAGIDCGPDCSEEYRTGTAVTVNVNPDSGSTFAGYRGDCDANGMVTLDEDRTCVVVCNELPPPPPPAPAPPAAAPAPAPPPPPPEIEETCLFGSNSARVDNRCKATLDEVALRMKNEDERVALVIGYSDSSGGSTSNMRMSERRAEAVKTYLVSRHGIDPSRITTEGRGSANPAGDNSTAAGRRENRRAVIVLKVR